jgi:acyl carrier protein
LQLPDQQKLIMTKQQFLHELEQIIEVDPGSIQGDETLKDLAGWDSMARVSFIAMADERLEALVSPAQLAACKSVPNLMALFPDKIS